MSLHRIHAPCFLRLFQVGLPAVDVYCGSRLLASLNKGDCSNYLTVGSGGQMITVRSQDQVLIRKKLQLKKDETYTLLVSNALLLFTDNHTRPPVGKVHVRFLHVASSTVDIFNQSRRLAYQVRHGTVTRYFSLKCGMNTFSNTVTNTLQVLLGPITIPLAAGGVFTVVLGKTGLSVLNDVPSTSCDIFQENFKVERYLGRWNTVAKLPTPFEGGHSSSCYTTVDGKLQVENVCYDRQWNKIKAITGTISSDPSQPAALLIASQPDLFGPNYLVHKTDYMTYAVVGSPNRKSLFILARNKSISGNLYSRLLEFCSDLGYNTSEVVADDRTIKQV